MRSPVARLGLLTLLSLSAAHADTRPRAWLEPLRLFDGPIWFDDERAVVERAIAEQLARGPVPVDVIPVDEVRELRADALAGRVPGRAEACPVATPPDELTAWTYPGAKVASSEVRCTGDVCTLTVTVGERAVFDELVRYTASLPADGTPESWAKAIAHGALRRAPTPNTLGGGGIMGGRRAATGIVATITDARVTGTWESPLTSASVTSVAPALWACVTQATTPARDNWSQPFVVEVGEDGHVTRCETAYPDHLAPPERPCQCDVLRTVDLGGGSTGRRGTFDLEVYDGAAKHTAPAAWTSAWLTELDATDPSVLLSSVSLGQGLSACLDALDPHVAVSVKARLRATVGADGRVTDASMVWPDGLPQPVRQCLQTGVEAQQFDCPRSGAASVSGTLTLKVEPRTR